jgi:hypothetical protein
VIEDADHGNFDFGDSGRLGETLTPCLKTSARARAESQSISGSSALFFAAL